ncbi:hypothetical protein B0I37DRAFT_381709 [Chaetomium sp. MPI-CAGE-AT-0009]|nr:hypothetical protein B0I37DRAFT_381709 [Chaetomium sp. MPI-CAGE-AT-0009]
MYETWNTMYDTDYMDGMPGYRVCPVTHGRRLADAISMRINDTSVLRYPSPSCRSLALRIENRLEPLPQISITGVLPPFELRKLARLDGGDHQRLWLAPAADQNMLPNFDPYAVLESRTSFEGFSTDLALVLLCSVVRFLDYWNNAADQKLCLSHGGCSRPRNNSIVTSPRARSSATPRPSSARNPAPPGPAPTPCSPPAATSSSSSSRHTTRARATAPASVGITAAMTGCRRRWGSRSRRWRRVTRPVLILR